MKRIDAIRAHWDRTLALGLTVVGLLMLVVGYFRISDTPYPAEQLPLLMSAGVGSLFLLGIGATLWLSADLRDEWHKLDELTGTEPTALTDARSAAAPDATPDAPVDTTGTGAGTRAGCRSHDGARATAR